MRTDLRKTVRPALTRREMLRRSASGFGHLALAGLLGEAFAAQRVSAGPLSWKSPLMPARAKRVIFLFMHGGPSQVDTFDYKPLLTRDHGKPLPFPLPRVVSSPTSTLLKSPWEFRQHGQCGAWVSSLFPHVAQQVDDICFLALLPSVWVNLGS